MDESVHESFPALPRFDELLTPRKTLMSSPSTSTSVTPSSPPSNPVASATASAASSSSSLAASSDNKENVFPTLPAEYVQQNSAARAQLLTPHKLTPSTRKALHRHADQPSHPTTTSSSSPASSSLLLPPLYRLERLSVDVSVPSAASYDLDPSHKETYLVGRDGSSADVHLDSTRQPNMMSRRHAILQWAASGGQGGQGAWRLIDLRSVNGLYVNDVRVSEALLKDGDVVCFGGGAGVKEGARRDQSNSEFRFVYRIQQREQPPAPPLSPSSAPGAATPAESASLGTIEYETAGAASAASYLSPTDGRSQRSISLPFAPHRNLAALDASHPSAAQLASTLESPPNKRRKTAGGQVDTAQAEAERRRLEKLEEEKREMQEQYLMALADMEKRDEVWREAEMRYRDEIKEERRRVAALEKERADKQTREEEERRRMEEAVRKLEAERETMDATQQEEKRRIQLELESMQRRMAEMQEASESERTSADLERMKEEFQCQFCISALVAPLTLACSHSFCSSCLADWFRTGHAECISCRQPVNLPPIRALSLDNAIAHMLAGDELAEWKQRREQWLDEQRTEQRRHKALTDHIEQQRRTNPASLQFLDVSKAWSDDEKKLFADGFAPYARSEECRRAYCSLVGLSEEWVLQRARPDELKRACINLKLKSDGVDPTAVVNGNRSELERAALQRRLWLLLKLGCKVK